MKLKEYMKKNKIKRVELSLMLGITYNYLCQIILEKKLPSPKLAEAIEIVTKGKVKKEHLVFRKKASMPNYRSSISK